MLPSFPTTILQISILITFASTQQNECLLPSHPDSGKWCFVSTVPEDSTRVPHLTILRVSCLPSHKLDGCTVTVCMNGQWVPPIGTCLMTCPSINSTMALQVTCLYKEQERRNCTRPLEGSIAKFKCERYYEALRPIRANAVCNNGTWSEDIPECTPICGEPESALIVSGAEKVQFPWQVALYSVDDEVLICGGTLLSERIIVSAAHCITDPDGAMRDKAIFLAVAGKHYRKLDHQEDREFVQRSKIRDMFIPENYEGKYQNYLGDISILITKESFTYSPRIQPACIDWNKKYAESLFNLNIYGYVSVWGDTKMTKGPSDALKHLKLSVIPTKECKRIAEHEYGERERRYVTYDKFCARFWSNESSDCSGDTGDGGGLVFKHGTRYYLTGVLSFVPRRLDFAGDCGSDNYGFYTLMYKYTDDFIQQAISKYKTSAELPDETIKPTTSTIEAPPPPTSETPPKGTCKIPQTSHGKWVPFRLNQLEENVPDNTKMVLMCDRGFIVQGPFHTKCIKGKWNSLGWCARLCPPLLPVDHTKYKCYLDGTPSDCAQAVENTVAEVACDLYYELPSLNTKPLLCLDGIWSNPLPRCVPSCGKGDAKLAPWLARISRKSECGIEEICMGTLISPGSLVTAAHCFTDESGHLKNVSEFEVSVGFPESYTQRVKIKMVQISPEYKGMGLNYYKDFAKVTLEKELHLSEGVHPICVHGAETVPSTSTDVILTGRKNDTITIKTLQRFTIEECYKYTTSPQQVYLTSGKFCAIPTMNSTLCEGDEGSGILAKHQGRYYLLGVASLVLNQDPLTICSSGTLIYTDIRGHIEELL